MEFKFTEQEEAFRAEVRDFISRHWAEPPASFEPYSEEVWPIRRAYERELAQRGWLTLAWPREYGGLGASHMQQLIFREESAYAGASGGDGQGITMVGPSLMVHGTEDQKRRFLPPIARAEVTWCQGFSEPGAGSDLASLRTSAVRDGDDFIINGQKSWTSNAQHCEWMHILVRTDPGAPKHKGLSYFLVDMTSPGIEVRPVIDMAGNHVLNDTFLTDVRVPADQMLGEVNRGWYVAATLLDFERSGIHYPAQARRTVEELVRWAKDTKRNGVRVWDDDRVQRGLAELYIETEIARLISYRVVWMQSQDLVPNHQASMSKLFGTELNQRVFRFGTNLIGLPVQQLDANDPHASLKAKIGRMYLNSIPYTIYAGTSEIQRNIMATRGLGLPRQ